MESFVYSFPGGIDEDADPCNQSPEDMVAHMGGLLMKELCVAISEAEKSL